MFQVSAFGHVFDLQFETLSTFTEYVETVYGPGTSVSIIDTADSKFVNSFLSTISESDGVKVRFGYGNSGSFWWSPWQDHVITEFNAVPRAIGKHDGCRIRLETSDWLLKFNREKRVRAWHGKASQIAGQLAYEYNLEKPVVEPTLGVYSLVQSYETDIEFIQRLLPRAVNENGRGNFRLFLRDGTLHFHSPGYQAGVHVINYGSNPAGLELTQSDRSQFQLQKGSYKVQVAAFNPLTGETKISESNENLALKLAKMPPPTPASCLNLSVHVGQNQIFEVENLAQNIFERARSLVYEVTLVTQSAPLIRAGDILNLVVQTGQHQSPWSGYFLVDKVKHVFEYGKLTTGLTLHRGELNLAGAPENAQNLNVMAVKSSSRSVGPESGGLKVVLDPNSQ